MNAGNNRAGVSSTIRVKGLEQVSGRCGVALGAVGGLPLLSSLNLRTRRLLFLSLYRENRIHSHLILAVVCMLCLALSSI